MGRVVGAYGVAGWVRVRSYAERATDILNYDSWLLEDESGVRRLRLVQGRGHGTGVVAQLEGIGDRDAALALAGAAIAVELNELPLLEPGDYYWAELEGLRVVTVDGAELGVVKRLMETGANDVLVVQGERERLIPYVTAVVRNVDLDRRTIEVDWDEDF